MSFKLFADAQGFYLSNNFYPREFTISYGTNFLSYEFDVDVEENAQDMIETGIVRKYIHGLWKRTDRLKPSIPATAFGEVFTGVYKRLAGDEKPKVAVSNSHLAAVLRKSGIPEADIFIPAVVKLERPC